MLRAVIPTARSGVILAFIDFRSTLLKWFVQLIILTLEIYSFTLFCSEYCSYSILFCTKSIKNSIVQTVTVKD